MEISEGIHNKRGFICDMDGVIYHANHLLPGAGDFIAWLKREGKQFLFLTNSSERSPRELREKLRRLGIDVGEDVFYTSALATAAFLKAQQHGDSVYVIGEAGLSNALYEAGFSMNDVNPDYVVVGETRTYNYEKIERAVDLVRQGARLIGTNSDLTGRIGDRIVPATKAMIAPIELASGRQAYFVGKPNPLMMRNGLKKIGCAREETVIVGDRMDTDIVAGIESEIDTVLVLTGVTTAEELPHYAYQPRYVVESIGALIPPDTREDQGSEAR